MIEAEVTALISKST